MKNILVTGGLGYIGSHTMIELFEAGYSAFSVDNSSTSEPWIADQISEITGRAVKNYSVDICSYDKLYNVFLQEKKIDGVIHFAAYKSVNESVEKPLMYFHNNLVGLINLLNCCKKFSVHEFIFSSSCTVYGNPDAVPVTENSIIKEPQSPYGRTKLMGEQLLKECVNNLNLKVASLRYFNPIGAHASALIGELPIGIPNNLVPFITQTAIGLRNKLTVFGNDYPTRDGTCIRDYVYVSDIAKAHVLAMDYIFNEAINNNWHIFNLGTGNGVSVKEVIDAFIESTGQSLNFEYGNKRRGDVAAIYANNDKSKKILGWHPATPLSEMMLSAWKWQKFLSKKCFE